jgi:hypothetical protein
MLTNALNRDEATVLIGRRGFARSWKYGVGVRSANNLSRHSDDQIALPMWQPCGSILHLLSTLVHLAQSCVYVKDCASIMNLLATVRAIFDSAMTAVKPKLGIAEAKGLKAGAPGNIDIWWYHKGVA